MYASYVKESVEAAVGRWGSFTGTEILALQQTLDALNDVEMTMVSRMAMRSKSWLRTEYLVKYVRSSDSTGVNSLLKCLSEKGVVDVLASGNRSVWAAEFNDAWDLLLDVLVSDEWKCIYKLLKLPPEQGNRRKELLMNDIKRSFNQHKPLFGTNYDKLLNILTKVLGTDILLVRLKPHIVHSFRRTQRLSMICSSSMGSGDISVYAPVPLNVPLLARFGKLRFAEYKIYSSIPLFPSERAFCQYESSCELFVAAELAEAIGKRTSGEFASNSSTSATGDFEMGKMLKRVVTALEHSIVPFFYPVELLLPSVVGNLTAETALLSMSVGVPANSSSPSTGTERTSVFCIKAASTSLMKHFVSIGGSGAAIPNSSSVSWYCKGISIQAAVTLVGTLCHISYLLEMRTQSDTVAASTAAMRPEFFASLDAGQKLTSLCSMTVNELEKQTCGCYSLAHTLLQLLLSTQTPFVRYRRGRWLNRLCVDLEHMHLQQQKVATSSSNSSSSMSHGYLLQVVDPTCATVMYKPVTQERQSIFLLLSLVYAKAAIADPSVRSGEKILFEKRVAKLSSRLFGSTDISPDVRSLVESAAAEVLMHFNQPIYLSQKAVFQVALLVLAATRTGTSSKTASISRSGDIERYFSAYIPKSVYDILEKIFPHTKTISTSRARASTRVTIDTASTVVEAATHTRIRAPDSQRKTSSTTTSLYWICDRCTFRNDGAVHKSFCSMCQNKRVISSSSDALMDVVVVLDEEDSYSPTIAPVIVIDSDDDDDDDEDAVESVIVPDTPSSQSTELLLNSKLFVSTHELNGNIATTSNLSDSLVSSDDILPISEGDATADSNDDLNSSMDGEAQADPPKYLFSDDLVLLGMEPVSEVTLAESSQYSVEQRVLVRALNAMDPQQAVLCTSGNSSDSASISHIFTPRSFTLIGRRFGDTKNAKGKSRFVGLNDAICNVEEYVLGQCFQGDADASPSFGESICGFDWQGWHCEGSSVRSLFALLMWDVIFADQPDVFQTPYQDAPLDIGYPCFCRSRLSIVYQVLDRIFHSTPADLISLVGNSYRAHRGLECRGMSWRYPLHTLQLLAVCLGGRVLAHICRALCVNWKYLGSGFPDLTLIRIRAVPSVVAEVIPSASDCVDVSTFLGSRWSSVYIEDRDLVGRRDSIDPDLSNLTDAKPKRARVEVSVDLEVINETDNAIIDDTVIDTDTLAESKMTVDLQDSTVLNSNDEIPDIKLPGVTEASDSVEYVYEAMFVEVKGPNDKLAAHQILWQRILTAAGARTFVGHVKEVSIEDSLN